MTTEYLNSDARKLVERIASESYCTLNPGSMNEVRTTLLIENTVLECCKMINDHMQYDNTYDCLLVLKIKEAFGIEANQAIV